MSDLPSRVTPPKRVVNVANVMSPSLASMSSPALTVSCRMPARSDATRLWEIAADSAVLDVNSSYSYVLWCHDFAATSIVAEVDGRPIGFVTGYRRPSEPSTLMVWQVAVDDSHRGHGIAATMLHQLLDHVESSWMTALHTTISPDNVGSQRLFASVARDRGLRLTRRELFGASDFPDSHEREDLYLLEPVTVAR